MYFTSSSAILLLHPLNGAAQKKRVFPGHGVTPSHHPVQVMDDHDSDLVLKQPWWRLGIPHDWRTPHIIIHHHFLPVLIMIFSIKSHNKNRNLRALPAAPCTCEKLSACHVIALEAVGATPSEHGGGWEWNSTGITVLYMVSYMVFYMDILMVCLILFSWLSCCVFFWI